jgi:hypothetical protein
VYLTRLPVAVPGIGSAPALTGVPRLAVALGLRDEFALPLAG